MKRAERAEDASSNFSDATHYDNLVPTLTTKLANAKARRLSVSSFHDNVHKSSACAKRRAYKRFSRLTLNEGPMAQREGTADFEFIVRCETPACSKHRDIINLISFSPQCNVDVFAEGYGHGSEGPEDFCPACGTLGVLYD